MNKFWRTLDVPLINFEVSLILTWSRECVITSMKKRVITITQRDTSPTNATFQIKDTKLYVRVVTLSIENDKRLLELLRTGFKITIKWSKYRSKITNQTKNNLNYLIGSTFTKVNRLFVFSFENENDRTSFSKSFTKCSNKRPECINRDKKFLLHANKKLRRNLRTNYWNGKKQWSHDRQFIGLWILFKTLKSNCKRFKQTNWIRKLWFKTTNNFTGRLERNEGATMFFIIEKSGETTFEFTECYNSCLILTTYENGNSKDYKFIGWCW